MKILIIGGGNMGFTYAKGIAQNKNYQVHILLKEHSKKKVFWEQFSEFTLHTDILILQKMQVILIAVKPQDSESLFQQMRPFVSQNQIFISVMAGVNIQKINNALDAKKIVRAMPNLPAQLGKGMTGFFVNSGILENELKIIKNILGSTGAILQVFSENEIDKITAISGSGTAYVFYFLEAMMRGAMDFGFDSEQAKSLVLETFLGALAQFKNTNENLENLIKKVASKGGTTKAALDTFEKNEVAKGIQKGILACYKRALELGNS